MLAVVFFYMTYHVELSSRQAYCLATRQPRQLKKELDVRRTHPLRVIAEALFTSLVVLNLISLWIHVRYSSLPLFSPKIKLNN